MRFRVETVYTTAVSGQQSAFSQGGSIQIAAKKSATGISN
jgi:Flp pilus assembly secretin CpaC